MVRKIGIAIVTVMVAIMLNIGLAAAVHAAPPDSEKPAMKETQKAVDAGNTVCPISGDPVDKDSKVTYTYKGKVYRFCCSMCIETFKKDPEKYIKQMEEQEKKNAR